MPTKNRAISGSAARNSTNPIPARPTSASPHVRFNRETDRFTASNGPTFSTTSTGTTKKVMIDHAVPRTLAMNSPTFSWACSTTFSSTPTVADTTAQAKICGNRAAANGPDMHER